MKKYFTISSLAVALMIGVPILVIAATNDVTVESGVSIELPSNGLTYTIQTNTTIPDFTVQNDYIAITVDDNTVFSIKSDNKSAFEVSNTNVCQITVNACESTFSQIEFRCPTNIAEQTLNVTPKAANTCTVSSSSGSSSSGSSSGGGGGGGGGGGETTPAPAPKKEEPKKPEPEPIKTSAPVQQTFNVNKASVVSVGSASHTVTVTQATETTVTVTIKSEPITVTLEKGKSKDIDTNGDGKNDLRVTYVALSDGKPELKFEEIIIAKVIEPEKKVETPAVSCTLTTGKAYKSSGSSAVYYITKSCTKRAFNSAKMFKTYFTSWSEVQSTTKEKITSVPNDALGFMPYGPLYDPQYGALVKIVSDPKVYLLLGSEKYWINSETVFNKLNYSWNWIEDIADDLLAKYTVGSEISYTNHHPNYTIIKYANSSKVYRLEPDSKDATKQVKRHVKDEKAFNSLKFRWDRIVTVPASEVYPDGALLEATVSGSVSTKTTAIETKTTAKYTFTETLQAGSSGEEVKQLQLKLKTLGHFTGDATGTFGSATEVAVKSFQKAQGLDQLGIVGPGTRAKLNAL